MSSPRRVMIFIDGSNIFWGIKHYNKVNNANFKIDYQKLINHVLDGRALVRAIYFCSKPMSTNSLTQKRFYDFLRKSGVQVIEKELKVRRDPETGRDRYVEKGVDVALAIELLGFAWEDAYDIAIIVSGDADYIEAIDRVMSKGKNVEIVAFKDSCSQELEKNVIKTTYIDNITNVIELTYPQGVVVQP